MLVILSVILALAKGYLDSYPGTVYRQPWLSLASSPGPQLDRIGGVTGEERKAEAKTEGLVNGVDPRVDCS